MGILGIVQNGIEMLIFVTIFVLIFVVIFVLIFVVIFVVIFVLIFVVIFVVIFVALSRMEHSGVISSLPLMTIQTDIFDRLFF